MTVETSRSGAGRLVTLFGGAGYIGPVVAKRLLRQGYRVRVCDMFLYGTQNVLLGLFDEPGFEVVNGDEGEGDVLERALDGATDVVILAGLVGDPITKKYPDAHQAVNEDGIAGIIDALDGRGLKRAIFVSTCSNYGLIPEGTLADEDFALNPLSLYAKAKVGMEEKLLGLAGKVDFEGVALRFAGDGAPAPPRAPEVGVPSTPKIFLALDDAPAAAPRRRRRRSTSPTTWRRLASCSCRRAPCCAWRCCARPTPRTCRSAASGATTPGTWRAPSTTRATATSTICCRTRSSSSTRPTSAATAETARWAR